jgi:hypothetical protein
LFTCDDATRDEEKSDSALILTPKVTILEQGANAGAFPKLATGAYPAPVTGDTFTFYGMFKQPQ